LSDFKTVSGKLEFNFIGILLSEGFFLILSTGLLDRKDVSGIFYFPMVLKNNLLLFGLK